MDRRYGHDNHRHNRDHDRNPNRNPNQNVAIALIAIGATIFLSRWFSFLSIAALVLAIIGLYKLKNFDIRRGYTLLAIGGILFILDNLMLIIGIILISLGFFYVKSKRVHRDDGYIQRQNVINSLKWNREPWFLRDTSMWHVIGDIDIDFSLAIPESKETILILQGAFGDVDISVPDDIGVSIEMTLLFGQIDVDHDVHTGFMNKRIWTSSNYDEHEYKVKLLIFYFVGDIDIRLT